VHEDHGMKTFGAFLNSAVDKRWVDSFTLQQLYPMEGVPGIHQIRPGMAGKEKKAKPCGNLNPRNAALGQSLCWRSYHAF
jgi:hypothetical protein